MEKQGPHCIPSSPPGSRMDKGDSGNTVCQILFITSATQLTQSATSVPLLSVGQHFAVESPAALFARGNRCFASVQSEVTRSEYESGLFDAFTLWRENCIGDFWFVENPNAATENCIGKRANLLHKNGLERHHHVSQSGSQNVFGSIL